MITERWTDDEIKESLDEFLEFFKNKPIEDNNGGGLSVNQHSLWFTLKKLNPKYVIESGVYQGQGTWIIENTLPDVKMFCIDPDLKQRKYISPKARYLTEDFLTLGQHNINPQIVPDTLIYFDDHQDQYRRLLHARSLGFKHFLFDDNYPSFEGKRHLTLESCLKNSPVDGYPVPSEAKNVIENLVDVYYIFKPIFEWSEPVTGEKSLIEIPPIFKKRQKKYDVFYNDMYNYRWATYVKLK